MNRVLDYSVLQGVINPSDLQIRPPRNINSRYITVENGSNREIGVAIETFISRPPQLLKYSPPTIPNPVLSTSATCPPKIQFILKPHEIKHLGVNNSSDEQFIHVIDPKTLKLVGEPQHIQKMTNQYVLREGMNKWVIERFYRT